MTMKTEQQNKRHKYTLLKWFRAFHFKKASEGYSSSEKGMTILNIFKILFVLEPVPLDRTIKCSSSVSRLVAALQSGSRDCADDDDDG